MRGFNGQLQSHCFHDADNRRKTRIPARGQGAIEALAFNPGCLGDFGKTAAGFGQASERLLVTSAKIKDFSKDFPKGPADFEALAARLNEKAKALGAAAAAKDAAAAKAALTEMKATCKECHSKFR